MHGIYAFTMVTSLQHSSTIQLVEKVKDEGSASPLEYAHACYISLHARVCVLYFQIQDFYRFTTAFSI